MSIYCTIEEAQEFLLYLVIWKMTDIKQACTQDVYLFW